MYHQEYEPPGALRDTIKCLWYNRREYGAELSGFEVVPDGYAEIIFYFGEPCLYLHNGAMLPLPSPFMIGLLNRPVVFYAKCRLEIIGIRCYPWMVFDFLNLPPGKDGVRTFEHPIARLHELVETWVSAGRIEDAMATVRQFLMNMQSQTEADNLLQKAGTAMSAAKGAMPVNRVAAAAHASVRTLERKFKRSSGYTVKDVSSVMRFEQVRNHLWLSPDALVTGLAYEYGYTDQSHLSREFKRYSGVTPSVFARRAKERKQAMSEDFVAFIAR